MNFLTHSVKVELEEEKEKSVLAVRPEQMIMYKVDKNNLMIMTVIH